MDPEIIENELNTRDRIVELAEKVSDDYQVLSNLYEISLNDLTKLKQWRHSSRWIRFEEVVEASGLRWSKPHVASLSSYCVFQVKQFLQSSLLILEAEERTWQELTLMITKKLSEHENLSENDAKILIEELNRPVLHFFRESSSNKVQNLYMASSKIKKAVTKDKNNSNDYSPEDYNMQFYKVLSKDTEQVQIFVGSNKKIKKNIEVIVRMKEPTLFPSISEVPCPTRVVVVMVGPEDPMIDYKEVGRCFGTIMVDEIFRKVMLRASKREDLIFGIDEFISNSTMLSPSEWENNIRLEPPQTIPNINDRIEMLKDIHRMPKAPEVYEYSSDSDSSDESVEKKYVSRRKKSEQEEEHGFDESLRFTKRIFGGLRDDIKRKIPFYLSDFKDVLDPKCFASFFFLYFACLAPIITFGGLLYQETGGYLGTMESLLSGTLVGVLFALFSGQPLTILGSTGPVLVFEKILYTLCKERQWFYLSFRLWVGLWMAFILFLCVMFDVSALVKYVTRFSEESFATLIAVIYVWKAIEKLYDIHKYYEVDLSWDPSYRRTIDHCYCNAPKNRTELSIIEDYVNSGKPLDFPRYRINESIRNDENLSNWKINWTDIGEGRYTWKGYKYTQFCEELSGTWTGNKCDKFFAPDIFFFSCLLCFGTFILAYKLKRFNTQPFFSPKIRQFISDFSVVTAILIMTLTDYFLGLHTLKLNVPLKFEPTLGFEKRSWLIPFFNGNPWWTSLMAFGPALLGSLLIFLDQQITAVIINRKSNKLRKGGGYHLDLLVLTVTIVTNSFLGIPFFVAATVLSMNHVLSLKVESKIKTPGEKPKFQGCIEQRVTAFMIFFTMGFSVFIAPLLSKIPMAVLYGIFLYMGIVALNEITMYQRCLLFFMPLKDQPDFKFLRHVRLRRVHLFTFIQVLCFIILLVIKSIPAISILFPIMVFAMCFIRKLLDYIFTQRELKYLDNPLPHIKLLKCCRKKEKIKTEDEELVTKNKSKV